ncbi:MAG: hypothetical protein ACREJC_01325 [Tepidisphaeraceae bacterium]
MIVSTSLVAVMMMGLIPAAHAGGGFSDDDKATAVGGPGGKGAPSLNVGVCLNVIVASCDDVASGNSGGGPGGDAKALAK